MKEKINIEQINQYLPQTQCQQCGYDGCKPYAKALITGEADINLCIPGQEEVMRDLSTLLQKEVKSVETHRVQTAVIEEDFCIGCTACIKACPVDAIIGASKLMHTIISDECTGCQLCIPPCPVDCIILVDEPVKYLPKNPILSQTENLRFDAAQHAKLRYENRQQRENKLKKIKKDLHHYQKQNNQNNTIENITHPNNIQSMLDAAKKRAEERKNMGRVKIKHTEPEQDRLKKEQEKAAFRKAQKNLRFGNDIERKEAIIFLRNLKHKNEERTK